MHRTSLAALSLAALLVAPNVARGAADETVTCKDGTTSKAGRGACRGHGGVDKKAAKASAGDAKEAAKESKKEAKEEGKEARKRAKESGAASAAAPAAAGETVTCKDGTTSKAGRGACRGHGGVAQGAARGATPPPAAAAPAPAPAPSPAPAAPPAAPPARAAPPALPAPAQAPSRPETNARNTDPTGAIARCKDGTYSHAKGHTGACSRHGGVAEWLDGTKR